MVTEFLVVQKILLVSFPLFKLIISLMPCHLDCASGETVNRCYLQRLERESQALGRERGGGHTHALVDWSLPSSATSADEEKVNFGATIERDSAS